jgi:CheY-like chemotaxis protein
VAREVVDPHERLIVVIDDDPTVLNAVADVLSGAGYLVEAATDWRDGCVLVQERQPDLVVADLVFDGDPKGWQLLQVLRTSSRTRAIPLVLISGYQDMLDRNESRLESMGIAVLRKPFSSQQLLDAIQPILERFRV